MPQWLKCLRLRKGHLNYICCFLCTKVSDWRQAHFHSLTLSLILTGSVFFNNAGPSPELTNYCSQQSRALSLMNNLSMFVFEFHLVSPSPEGFSVLPTGFLKGTGVQLKSERKVSARYINTTVKEAFLWAPQLSCVVYINNTAGDFERCYLCAEGLLAVFFFPLTQHTVSWITPTFTMRHNHQYICINFALLLCSWSCGCFPVSSALFFDSLRPPSTTTPRSVADANDAESGLLLICLPTRGVSSSSTRNLTVMLFRMV